MMYANDIHPEAQVTDFQNTENQPPKSLTSKVTTYLRWIGSILIILSAISFMLQGHEEILPAYRYWIGLGLTLLLCGGGFGVFQGSCRLNF